MARYLAFFIVGSAFSVGSAAMVETHLQVSNPAAQVAGYQSAHLVNTQPNVGRFALKGEH